MAEFTPITTQEQFDAAIGERIKRERESLAKKYGDYDTLKKAAADYEKQIGELNRTAEESAKKYAGYDKTLADLQARVKGYETDSVKTRIAHELGLPYGMARRITGETEEDIRADAEALSREMEGSTRRTAAPLRSTETPGDGGKHAALKGVLQDLRGE